MKIGHVAAGILAAISLAPQARAGDAVVPDEFELQQRSVGACDHLGTGFFQLPGTGTCARVGGRVRYDKSYSNRGGTYSGGRTELEFETRSN